MGNISKKVSKLFGTKETRLLMLGLDGAGKTTTLNHLKTGPSAEVAMTEPTVGFNVETVTLNKIKFNIWDVGGQDSIRGLWRHYYLGTQGLIFVVDCGDTLRLGEAKMELHRILSDKQMEGVPLLVLANKADLPNAMSLAEVTDKLKLHSLRSRKWYIQLSCCATGDGLYEGFDWLSATLANKEWTKVTTQPDNPSKDATFTTVTEEKATNVTEDVIKSSFAAKVTGGRTIKESSRCSGISYAYDVDSNKDGHLCALCLSVSENIQFKANNDSSKQELETIAKMMIKDMYENKAVALLKELEKVYEEETCVICMEDDKPPDVVFYQCGHQCCHGDCSTKLQTCPICRRNIAATIKVQPTI